MRGAGRAGGDSREGKRIYLEDFARGKKLQHELYTGPWQVSEVLQRGLSVQVSMQGRRLRNRRVSLADVKPLCTRPLSLRHSLTDGFAQYRSPDSKLPEEKKNALHFVSIVTCQRVTNSTGVRVWEFKGRWGDGRESDWLSESQMLETLTPLQLDIFVALCHLYHPSSSLDSTPPPETPGAPLSRREALRLFPIGHTFWKDFGKGVRLRRQVFDFYDRYWRVRYSDQDWEELTRQELQSLSR